jgi:hypothetical protein
MMEKRSTRGCGVIGILTIEPIALSARDASALL